MPKRALARPARAALKTDAAADGWMNAPAGGGKTPAELVGEGRHEEALALAAALK